MRRFVIPILLLVAIAPDAAPEPPRAVGLRRGLTRDEVRGLLGPPQSISRQVLFRRHVEQWHYSDPPRWVEFNCSRGEPAYVIHFEGQQ